MTPEDIGDIFQALEDALFAMAIRNMKHHENWEEEEGFKWTQWQAEQINSLRAYRQNVAILTNYHFNLAKKAVETFLREAYEGSVEDAAETATRILGSSVVGQYGRDVGLSQRFFGADSHKLDIIINEAVQNIDTKRYAAINRMNFGYTDFLRKADIFAQSGSYTIPQVIDMASKDFLSAGLNCVEYSNGNRVNIASYAEMALRTSSSEVTRQANGDVRNELGEYLVVSNVIGMTCPYCQKWQGKVLIDDVYSDGKPDGEHKLVSEAKADHFLHPNCRHQLYMYIEGITEIADLPNDVETKEHYKAEQEQRRQEREIRKYKRLRDGAVDPADRQKYDARVKEWTAKHNQYLQEHDYLRKNPKRLAQGFTGNGKPEEQYFENGTAMSSLHNRDGVTSFNVVSVEESRIGIKAADGLELSHEQISYFDDSIESINSLFADNGYDRPQVIVVSESGLSSSFAVASYNAVDNSLRVFVGLADEEQRLILQQSGACPDNPLSTLLHEFFHWSDACEYQKEHGTINSVNISQYLEYRNALARRLLGEEFDIVDAHGISRYAERKYLQGQYDETYTELRVLLMLGG